MSVLKDHDTLAISLEAAVPLHLMEVRELPFEARHKLAMEASDAIASRGDVLMYGGKKGAAAEVFNQLARGLAVLACQPGGVTFAGMHWCIDHDECMAAAKAAAG